MKSRRISTDSSNSPNEMKQMENKTEKWLELPEFACSSDTVMDLSSDKFFSLIRNVAFPHFSFNHNKNVFEFFEDSEVNK